MTVNPVASEYTLSVSSISSPSPFVWDNSPVRDNIASCLPGGQSPSTGGSRPPFPLAPVPAEGPSDEKARGDRAGGREPGNADITDLGDDVFQIDTKMAGYQGITAGYLIRSSRPCLVETGTSTSAPVVQAALASLDVLFGSMMPVDSGRLRTLDDVGTIDLGDGRHLSMSRYRSLAPEADPEVAEKFDRLSGTAANVRGIWHWLDKLEQPAR